MLEALKWIGGLLVAIGVILGAIITIEGDWSKIFPPKQTNGPEAMGALLFNINLLGNDFNHGESAATAEECQTRCAWNKTCKAMTYEILGAGPGRCWMKNVVPSQSQNARSISSVKSNS